MRALMAIVLFAGGILALDTTADAQSSSRYKRIAKSYQYKYKTRARLTAAERLECERARQEDPAGEFKGYPCWAREAFARGRKSWN
jgi:hypothetical protein